MLMAIGNIKGGVGKTTLAVNFAIAFSNAGRDVLLVDGDEQGTASAFTELRASTRNGSGPGYAAVSLQGAAVRTQVRQQRSKYTDIVIDVGGRDTASFRAALTVADLLLVPVQPRSFDIWSMQQVAELVAEAREIHPELRAVSVLNGADPSGQDNVEAAQALSEIEGIEHAPMLIVRRKAYPNAAAAGKSVLEYSDPKAVEEFGRLLEWVTAAQ